MLEGKDLRRIKQAPLFNLAFEKIKRSQDNGKTIINYYA